MLRHCWLGHMTRKIVSEMTIWCVEWDVKQYWLKVPWRIDYQLAVLVYKLPGTVIPCWRTSSCSKSEFRRRPRSASSHELSVPRTRLSTYGDRAFPVVAVRIWNSLPQHYHICSVTSCLLLSLEDILLRTCTCNYCCDAKWHCHLWTR